MATVLVVDDEPIIADVLAAVLSDEGHDTVTAAHGNHALELLDQFPYIHLVISDLVMPKLDGAGLLLAMRDHEQHRGIPFILMSSMPEHNVQARGVSYTAFFSKPFVLADVVLLVANVLRFKPRTFVH